MSRKAFDSFKRQQYAANTANIILVRNDQEYSPPSPSDVSAAQAEPETKVDNNASQRRVLMIPMSAADAAA